MQAVIGKSQRGVAGTQIPLRPDVQRGNLPARVVWLGELIQIPFENSGLGIPLDVEKDFVPVIPLQRGAIDPLDFWRTIVAAHNAYGCSNIFSPGSAARDGIVRLDGERDVGEFPRTRWLRAAVIVKFENPVPFACRGLIGLFTLGAAG